MIIEIKDLEQNITKHLTDYISDDEGYFNELIVDSISCRVDEILKTIITEEMVLNILK